jgi:hypothetical protein
LITLSELGKTKSKHHYAGLVATINQINSHIEKHMKRLKSNCHERLNIENGLTTPTMKENVTKSRKFTREFYKSWFENEDKVIFE